MLKNWEQIKAEERQSEKNPKAEKTILSAVPRKLPALLEAHQITRRAANIGFDWNDAGGIFDKIEEESIELRAAIHDRRAQESANGGTPQSGANVLRDVQVQEEVGDLLFAAVNMARFLGLDAEVAAEMREPQISRSLWLDGAASGSCGTAAGRPPAGENGRAVERI